MLRKISFLFVFIFMLSCSEESDITNSISNSSTMRKPLIPTRNITVAKWKLDYYTNSNKRIGIWPGWNVGVTNVPLNDYKNKYGFTDILAHSEDEVNASLNHFDRWTTMVLVSNNGYWQSQINNYNVTRYYIDEPLETQNMDTTDLRAIYEYIKNNRNDATLIMGSRISESASDDTIQTYREFINWEQPKMYILYSSYGDGNASNRYWWEQYKHWSYYGSHSRSNWIGAKRDYGTYDMLLEKANNLGLNRMWFYIGSEGGANNVAEFSYNLWEYGWLDERHERKYLYHYYYTGPYPPLQYDPSDPNWVLLCCESTTNTRIANRSNYSSFPEIDNDVCNGGCDEPNVL